MLVIVVSLLPTRLAYSDTVVIGAEPARPASDVDAVVTLPFVTNRAVETGGNGERYFGNKLGPLASGRCTVGVSDGGATGKLLGVAETTPEATLGAVDEHADPSIVVYFHGYYEDFDRACRRAARFKYRLNIDSELLLFTWPANSTPLTYAADVADLEASVPVFLQMLGELGRHFGPSNVSVIGHSLGTRGLVQSLRDAPVATERFRDLILIASDAAEDDFVEGVPVLREQVKEITLLVSERDRALGLSRIFNGAPRVGQAVDLELEGVTILDVTDIADTHFSGHIYHLRNPAVVDLIRSVLLRNAAEIAKPVSPSGATRSDPAAP